MGTGVPESTLRTAASHLLSRECWQLLECNRSYAMKKITPDPLLYPSMLLTVTTRCWTVPPSNVRSITTCKTISLIAL